MNKQHGFTLIELMISVFIVLMLLIPLAGKVMEKLDEHPEVKTAISKVLNTSLVGEPSSKVTMTYEGGE